MLLKEKIAIVTGGGRGIGRGIAHRFAREGASVVLAQRDPESGRRTQGEIEKAGGTALFAQTNVSQRDAVEGLVETTVAHYGGVDILVNNAGITGYNGDFLEMTQDTWDRILSVNLTGVFMCSQIAGRIMAERGGGNIIHISSVNGFVAQPRCAAYGAAKGGIENLTKSMATDLAQHNIRVNAIAPGAIQVDQPDDAPPQPSPLALLERAGLPGEIGAAAAFLASDESSYVNGHTLLVDGGTLPNAYNIYCAERPNS